MTRRRAVVPLALGALVLVSLLLRTQRMDVDFWIDEALSVGIADRPFGDIASVLRQDGSPPLYYWLLHVWMRVLGDRSEVATHALSLVIALATVPLAWALARALLGERAGWCAAVLAAINPFLTQYAQETRMYALVVLLGLVACAGFAGAFVLDRGRGWAIALAVSLAALLYTHNWGLFLGAALGLVWLVLVVGDRALLRPGLLTFGAVAVAYAPWVPNLLFQAGHTGAPWAKAPGLAQLTSVPGQLLGKPEAAALAVAGVAAAAALRGRPKGRAAAAWLVVFVVTMLLAWVVSQASPAWATRYLAVGVPPLLLAAAAATAFAGRAGIAALVVVVLFSVGSTGPTTKSNVATVAEAIAPTLVPGDLVISTQPEQVPALAYYLPQAERLRWATLSGPLRDLGVTDWRDGVERLEATSPARDLAPLLDAMPPGAHVALIEPEVFDVERWSAPWTMLVRVRSQQWRAWMLDDRRFRVVAIRPEDFDPPAPNPVRATVFLKTGMR